MTAPSVLNAFGISTQDAQDFVLKYAAQWAGVPQRLNNIITAAQRLPDQGQGQQIVQGAQNLQAQYASLSSDVSTLLMEAQSGNAGGIDVGLAAQTVPQAIVVIQGTDRLEQAVNGTGPLPTAVILHVQPWVWYVGLGAALLWLLKRARDRS